MADENLDQQEVLQQDPPTKYLYNGKIYQQKDIDEAAKQSGMDANAYIKKSGLKPLADTYSYKGKSLNAEDVLDAANQSKMDFDTYISKAGIEPSGNQKKNPVGNVSQVGSATQSPSSGQSSSNVATFDPNTAMQQSRAAVLGNSAQDNQSAQVSAPKQIAQQQVQEIQQNTANSIKAKPVTQQAQIKTDDQPFDLTKSIQTDFPDTDPNQILGNKDLLSGYYQQKNTLLQNQINQMEGSEKREVLWVAQ